MKEPPASSGRVAGCRGATVPAFDLSPHGEHLGGFDGTVAAEVFTDAVPLLRDSARRATTALAAPGCDPVRR